MLDDTLARIEAAERRTKEAERCTDESKAKLVEALAEIERLKRERG